MSDKPKFAMYWAASCGGCEIAVLNIFEKILDVDAHFDVVFWPAVMDAKIKDVEALPDDSITLMLFNGGIRNAENEHMAHLLRQKSKILVAFGSCATEGCIPGLANLSSPIEIFDTVYEGVSTDNPEHLRPQNDYQATEGTLHLPKFCPTLRTLDDIVKVDYYLPGCPPESHQIAAVIEHIIKVLEGQAELPPVGAVLGSDGSTVCSECPRARNIKTIKQFKRIQHLEKIDPTLCLLEQGIPCNGAATRSGCGSLCPKAGAPCIGCYGPAEDVVDYGARLISAFASVIDSKDPHEIEQILDTLPDPVGQFYRFSLAKSLLGGRKPAQVKEG